MEDFEMEDQFSEKEDPNKRKNIELTQHQRNKIKETLRQMDENLVQPQVTAGKKFLGPGFASKPEKIIYKDFQVGAPMSITIELTNISNSFNSFKLLPLDDEILDFFEIEYRPCGRIPAGISTMMTLKFMPMVDKDYFSYLKLLSETGIVNIPIECLSKKCDIKVANEIIDFGDVRIYILMLGYSRRGHAKAVEFGEQRGFILCVQNT